MRRHFGSPSRSAVKAACRQAAHNITLPVVVKTTAAPAATPVRSRTLKDWYDERKSALQAAVSTAAAVVAEVIAN